MFRKIIVILLIKRNNCSCPDVTKSGRPMDQGNYIVKILIALVIVAFIFLNWTSNLLADNAEAQSGWYPVSAGPLTTWTAPLCGRNKFVVQPFFFYNRVRGTFDQNGRYQALPSGDKKYQYQQQLFAQYGLTERLELDGQVVYQENYFRQAGLKARSVGLGDSYLFLRYCAVEDKGWVPHFTGLLQLKIPTGKYQHLHPNKLATDLMGAGSWDYGLGINLTKKLKTFILHADTVFNFPRAVKDDGIKTDYGKYLNYDFGGEYFFAKNFNLMAELNGFFQGERIEESYLVVAPGIGWSNDIIQTLVAYSRTLSGKNTDANDSVVFTFVWTF